MASQPPQTTSMEDIGKEVLDYKPPEMTQERQEEVLEEMWGRLPNNRWKNVGRMIQIKVFGDDSELTTGDDKLVFMIPPELDGTKLVRAVAFVSTVSSSGLPNVMISNTTQAVDVLATAITIDVSEFTSLTAATPCVIKQDIIYRPGDLVAIDVDGAGTGAKGLGVQLSFI